MEVERPIRLLAIQAANEKGGLYLAWVPNGLTDDQVQSALAELGIVADQAMEVGDWKTSSSSVAVAFVPFPSPFQGTELLESSQS